MGVSNPNIFSCREGAHRWLPGNSHVQKGLRSCSLFICDMALEDFFAFTLYYYNGCDELIGKNLLLYPNNRHATINCFVIFFLFSFFFDLFGDVEPWPDLYMSKTRPANWPSQPEIWMIQWKLTKLSTHTMQWLFENLKINPISLQSPGV